MAKIFRMPLNVAEVKRRREKFGFTLEEASKHANAAAVELGYESLKLTRQGWYEIESGRRGDLRISTLESISVVLKCRVDDLLTSRSK